MAIQSPKNLIVNYLPQHMTERELYSMFVTVGPVENCRVMKDIKTGYSYGYGFVSFTRPQDAEKAIQQLNGLDIFNKRIKVSFARPNGEDLKDTNLYITNLPRHFNEHDLEMLFSSYGNIVQKNLLVDKITGMKRGVGFVRFNRREEAQEAIRNLDGQTLDGSNEALCVRVAQDHGKKRAAYFAGLQAGLQRNREARSGFVRGSSSRGNMNMGSGFRTGVNHDFYNTPNDQGSFCETMLDSYGTIRHGKQQQRYFPFNDY